MPGKTKKWLPAILATILLFGLSSIPAQKVPSRLPYGTDKVVHSLLYAGTGIAYYFSWGTPLSASIGVFALGALDENYQRLTPGRTCTLGDWIADVIGGLIGVGFAYRWVRRKTPQPQR